MESAWRDALWPQFGAVIDMLDNAIAACPDSLWHGRLWPVPPDLGLSEDFSAFWYLAYHTLFWLDCYLSGSEEGFAPPVPFTLAEFDPAGVLPERTYTKEELRDYLTYVRQKGRAALVGLTEEQARRPCDFPWTKGQPVSYLELQLYNMRHAQEHTSQLCLFLGQNAIPDVPGWVARAKG